jgi:hypothetical protein
VRREPSLLPEGGRPATDWPAPRLVPTSYPGAVPDHHYLLLGDRVHRLSVEVRAGRLRLALPGGAPVDEVLARVGAVPLGGRIPMLAYGANRGPHSLAVKLRHHGAAPDLASPRPSTSRGPEHAAPVLGPASSTRLAGGPDGPITAVPVLRGTVDGVDTVVAGLSSQGFVYADLTSSPSTRITAYCALLDPDQARAIHDSEGVGRGVYDCAWLPGFAVEGTGMALDVVAYAGCLPVFVSPAHGTPLAFSAVPAAGRRVPAHDQLTLFGEVLATTGILDQVASLLGPISSRRPAAVAAEAARMLSGQWWYRHNTGDSQTTAAVRVQQIVWDALRRHGAAESMSQHLAPTGAVLAPEVADAAGPELRLAAQGVTG